MGAKLVTPLHASARVQSEFPRLPADSKVRDSGHFLRNDRNVPDDSDGPATDVVKTLGQLFGLAAGFIALVYAAGGGVLALRLYLSDLPSRTVVGQLKAK